jgi:multidrug resistance protein, MATE family
MLSIKDHIKQTISLALPVVIGQLGYIIMGVVDSVYVGRIGAAPLAASALGNGLFFLILVVGLGVSYAISPIVAILVGGGKTSEYRNIFHQSFIVNLVIGFILMVLTFLFSGILYHLGQPIEVTQYAVSYTRILGISIIPVMVFQTYKQFIEGFSIMKPAMYITLFANIINALMGLVMIYGNLGMPRLELSGAGIATFSSRIFMMIAMIVYVVKNEKFRAFEINLKNMKLDFKQMKKLLSLGLPSGMQYFFEVGAFTAAAVIVGWLGTYQLAAHQIALNLASITYMTMVGISSAAAIRVGNFVGKKDIMGTRKAGFVALGLAFSIMSVCGVCFVLLKNVLPALYIDDSAVIKITADLLLIVAFFEIFDGTQAVALGVLRGITDVKLPTIITFVAYWVVALPLGYLLGFPLGFGVQGVWIGLSVGLIVSATMLTLRFILRSKIKIAV